MLRETIVVFLFAALAQGQSAPRLLADLDQRPIAGSPASSLPASFARLGAWTFFAADDGVHGRELFRTNGTAAGTSLFADLRVGPAGSSPRMLIALGTRLVFLADDGVDGMALFVCDGTLAGTQRVVTIVPAASSGAFVTRAMFGTRLVFVIWTPSGEELWITDASETGTQRIIRAGDLPAGERLMLQATVSLTEGTPTPRLIFSSVAANGSASLWRTDGTRPGTSSIPLPSGTRSWFRTMGPAAESALVLTLESLPGSSFRTALWAWDGTSAPQLLMTIPGLTLGAASERFDGRTWFFGIIGESVLFLVSDGTPGGTRVIPTTLFGSRITLTAMLGVLAGSLWFAGGDQLLRVDPGMQDPVRAGTLPIAVTLSNPGRVMGAMRLLVTSDGRLRIVDPRALTVTDLGISFQQGPLVEFGEGLGRVYFALPDASIGTELWMTDGTAFGTRLVADLRRDVVRTRDSLPRHLRSFGSEAALMTHDDEAGTRTIWLSDGTPSRTRTLATGFGSVSHATELLGRLLVRTWHSSSGTALFVSDGTPAGSRLLPIPTPRGAPGTSDAQLAFGHELVLFLGTSDACGLYATDGVALRTVAAIPAVAIAHQPARLGERIVFATWVQFPTSMDLWSTDATTDGTRRLASFAGILATTRWRDRVWFLAWPDSGSDVALWSTDGTIPGTVAVAGLGPQRFGRKLVVTRERLFVLSADRLFGFDGASSSPTVIPVSLTDAAMRSARAINERLVFESTDAATGRAVLWSSDGTLAGTVPITAPFVRDDFESVRLFAIGERQALFRRGQSGAPTQTWVTDGVASGTHFYSDRSLWVTPNDDDDDRLHSSNGLAYVALQDPVAGIEPHVIELSANVESLSRGCGGVGREAELFASLGSAPQGGLTIEGRSSMGSLAWLLISAPPLRSSSFPSAGRCILDVDPNAFVTLAMLPLANGRFAGQWPLPDDPALRGVQATLQAVIGPTDAPLGLDLSNGLLLTLAR